MSLRSSLVVLFALAGPASAQITLTAAQTVPYESGETTLTQYDSENEDGADTATIDALIAQSGPNQTWDFTALSSVEVAATALLTDGPTGPGADADPLDQATSTYQLLLPPQEEDGQVIEGTVYGYYRLDATGLHNLGIWIVSMADGQTFESSFRLTPGGALTAPPTYTAGSVWESTYTQEFDLFGITTNLRGTYEVDGWGSVVAPGLAAPVPVLRVKVTETDLDSGGETVAYEFRSASGVAAALVPGEGGLPPSASVTVTGEAATATSAGPLARGVGAPWPNPATRTATLDLDLPGVATVAVVDMLGRYVLAPVERAPGHGRIRLDVSALPAGLYVVRVEADGRVATRSLTVVR